QVINQEEITASDYGEVTRHVLTRLDSGRWWGSPRIEKLDAVGHRVVHGGDRFTEIAIINDDVVAGIEALEDLAPLHNAQPFKSSALQRVQLIASFRCLPSSTLH